jgi:hypothetical protein
MIPGLILPVSKRSEAMKRSLWLVSLLVALAALAFPVSASAEPPDAACNFGTELAHTLVEAERAHEAIPLCP